MWNWLHYQSIRSEIAEIFDHFSALMQVVTVGLNQEKVKFEECVRSKLQRIILYMLAALSRPGLSA